MFTCGGGDGGGATTIKRRLCNGGVVGLVRASHARFVHFNVWRVIKRRVIACGLYGTAARTTNASVPTIKQDGACLVRAPAQSAACEDAPRRNAPNQQQPESMQQKG